ncbi:MAG: glycosyltransferase family 2 protein [Eubacteriales bacterium]
MDTPSFSVIVPVYKIEAYLYRCVDSILNQSFGDFELILIDDGSPDNSGAICDEYARRNSRVKVIHTQNRGLCTARNTGLQAAKGEYIAFCDSDDFLASSYHEKLESLIRQENVGQQSVGFSL